MTPASALLTIAIVFFVPCQTISFESLILEEWQAFKTRFNKTYNSELEESFRREIFLENRHKIALHNVEYGRGTSTFLQALNRFGDMLNHEFTYILNGFNRTARLQGAEGTVATMRTVAPGPRPGTFIQPLHAELPERVDWRERGAVTPVRSQGLCASCWAFAAAGAIEGHTFRRTGQLLELSPQHLLDCTQPYGNSGCMGGLTDNAYEYVRDAGAINADARYPYEMRDGICRFDPTDRPADDVGYVLLPEGDEEAIKQAVATLGPVSVAIDAGQDSFQFYSDGVYFDPRCESDGMKLNHAVLIVGYGTEPSGMEYWIVKNSYGPDWGQGGYIKMARNQNNHCGIAVSASYPIV